MMETEFRNGLTAAIPTGLGYLSIGLALGVIAAAAGLSPWQVWIMSTFLYTGAAQFALVALLVAGESLTSIAVTIFFINLRNFLMSLHTATFFPEVGIFHSYGISAFLTDETYGVLLSHQLRQGRVSPCWMMGNNLLSYLSWNVATVLGAFLGEKLPNPESLGLDFALLAMFIGIFAGQFRSLTSRKPLPHLFEMLLVVAVVFLLLSLFLPKSIAVLLATLAGCAWGVMKDEQ